MKTFYISVRNKDTKVSYNKYRQRLKNLKNIPDFADKSSTVEFPTLLCQTGIMAHIL